MRNFYLIRHGDAYDRNWKQTGLSDLNSVGKQHAQALADRFKHASVDAVYSSTMVRALETCQEFLKHHKHIKPVLDDSLREVVDLSFTSDHQEIVFLTSNFESIKKKVVSTFDYVVDNSRGEHVFVFTHGYWIRFLVSGILEFESKGFFKTNVDFASVTCVREDKGHFELDLFNDCSHTKGLKLGCSWC